MVMIKDNLGVERFCVSNKLLSVLNRIKDKINKEDQECWIAYIGNTGSGKSLRAQRDAFIIDNTIEEERVCFSRDEFIKAVIKAKKGQVVIADEAISIFFNRSSMTKEGREISEVVNQIRQKNLCVMICIPFLLSLDRMILKKLNIVAEVIETREDDKTYKGNTNYYLNVKGLKQIDNLYRYYRMVEYKPSAFVRKPFPMFKEKGNSITSKVWYPVDESKYKGKKESVLDKYIKKDDGLSNLERKQKFSRDKAILYMSEKMKMSQRQIAKELNLAKSTVNDILAQFKARPKTDIIN